MPTTAADPFDGREPLPNCRQYRLVWRIQEKMKKPLFHDAPQHAPGELYINHRDGTIRRPNHDPIALEGPTTGAAYEELKAKEKQNNEAMAFMRRQMASTFQCTQCKRKQSGKYARIAWRKVQGVLMETLVCRDQKCDGPLVKIVDALDMKAGGVRQ